MAEDIVRFIQYHFKQLTNSNIQQYKVEKFILPIINYINKNKSNKFLIAGPQGIGKTTLLKIIEIVFQKYFNKRILTLNLDDFYLSKNKRIKLAKTVHPLLITRGVPGTHDVNNLLKIINQFDNSRYPILIPIFNKLIDTKKNTKRIIKHQCNILILEGWCVGCPPLTNKVLFSDINTLEKKFDKNKKWRNYYNNQLKTYYLDLFKQFNTIIFFKSPSFSCVLRWRLKQENQLKKMNKKNKTLGMNKNNIVNFIQHYEKITKWMLKKMSNNVNLVLYINKNQQIIRMSKK